MSKACTKCNRELPATNEYFAIDNTVKSGIRSQCKDCRNKENKEYTKKNWDRIYKQRMEFRKRNAEKYSWYNKVHCWVRRRMQSQKYCSICNEEKKLELANISGNYIKSTKEFSLLCKECHNLYDRLRKLPEEK